MIPSLFSIIGSALSIWEHKEKNKLFNKFVDLQRQYYEESNKPENEQDFSVMDNIEFELWLLGNRFSAKVREQGIKDLQK